MARSILDEYAVLPPIQPRPLGQWQPCFDNYRTFSHAAMLIVCRSCVPKSALVPLPWVPEGPTVEPVLMHDVCQETFDAVREVYAIRPRILAKFISSLLCPFAGYALRWDAVRQVRLYTRLAEKRHGGALGLRGIYHGGQPGLFQMWSVPYGW